VMAMGTSTAMAMAMAAAGAAAKIVLDFMAGLCQLGRTACTRGQQAKGPPTGLSQLCYCQSCPMQNGPLQRGPTFLLDLSAGLRYVGDYRCGLRLASPRTFTTMAA
jgi:hypothetical protein